MTDRSTPNFTSSSDDPVLLPEPVGEWNATFWTRMF